MRNREAGSILVGTYQADAESKDVAQFVQRAYLSQSRYLFQNIGTVGETAASFAFMAQDLLDALVSFHGVGWEPNAAPHGH